MVPSFSYLHQEVVGGRVKRGYSRAVTSAIDIALRWWMKAVVLRSSFDKIR